MGFSMVYLTSSSNLRISVTPNLCDLTVVTYALGPRSGKWTNSSVICKTSFVSPCFQCLGTWFDWWRGRANELIGFWIPFVFFWEDSLNCCLVRGFSEKNLCGSFSLVTKLLRFQGKFLIADFAANCVKVLNVHYVAPDPLPSRKL